MEVVRENEQLRSKAIQQAKLLEERTRMEESKLSPDGQHLLQRVDLLTRYGRYHALPSACTK